MEFGKVDIDLNSIDFTLPPDPEGTTRLLQKQKTENIKPEFFVGCAKWGRKDWVGKIYPSGTKEADFLSLYAKYFNCIELNATFYRPSNRESNVWLGVEGWKGFQILTEVHRQNITPEKIERCKRTY
jgi:hypothetical protein